jgi:hypothetical protein
MKKRRASPLRETHSLGIRFATDCKNQNISAVAVSFRSNINSAIQSPSLIKWSFAEGVWRGRAQMAAWHKVIGIGNSPTSISETMARRMKALASKMRSGRIRVPGVGEGVDIDESAKSAYQILRWVAHDLDAMFRAQIILAWSAFEVLAGDLWEAAINTCPERLIRSGSTLSIDTIRSVTKRSYNLEGKLGSALAVEQDFAKLVLVRDAYGKTFKEHAKGIKTILNDRYLDALSAVRNVLVHNSGTMDADYEKDYKSCRRLIPQPERGGKLPLDAGLVRKLLSHVRDTGAKLVKEIDLWLTRHGAAQGA